MRTWIVCLRICNSMHRSSSQRHGSQEIWIFCFVSFLTFYLRPFKGPQMFGLWCVRMINKTLCTTLCACTGSSLFEFLSSTLITVINTLGGPSSRTKVIFFFLLASTHHLTLLQLVLYRYFVSVKVKPFFAMSFFRAQCNRKQSIE